MTPLIERLLPLLEREGLKVVHLIKEDSSVVFKNVFFEPTLENLSSSLSGADLVLTENFGADAPNKIEILRKYWSEQTKKYCHIPPGISGQTIKPEIKAACGQPLINIVPDPASSLQRKPHLCTLHSRQVSKTKQSGAILFPRKHSPFPAF